MSEKQGTLFDAPQKPTTEQKWQAFMDAHRWFVPAVIKMARERKAAGSNRWSTKAAFEILRPRCHRSSEYGLNNNYSALCAREVMRQAPDLQGFFELR